MRVKVLYFGVLKERFAAEGEAVELAAGATVGEALRLLQGRASNESGMWSSLAVAVNREYAGVSRVLEEGDEVALLPPVSGGAG